MVQEGTGQNYLARTHGNGYVQTSPEWWWWWWWKHLTLRRVICRRLVHQLYGSCRRLDVSEAVATKPSNPPPQSCGWDQSFNLMVLTIGKFISVMSSAVTHCWTYTVQALCTVLVYRCLRGSASCYLQQWRITRRLRSVSISRPDSASDTKVNTGWPYLRCSRTTGLE